MKMKPEKTLFPGEFVTLVDMSNAQDPITECQTTLTKCFESFHLLNKKVSLCTVSGLSKYKKQLYFELLFRYLSSFVDKDNAWMLDDDVEIQIISDKIDACMYEGNCGLAIWSEPFKLKHYRYGEVYVYLLITNNEVEYNILQSSITLFEVSSLISSVHILLHLDGSATSVLEYFKEVNYYAKIVPTQTKSTLFESLLLVPYDLADNQLYGLEGGRHYLDSSSHKDVSKISKFYHDCCCFTLPKGVDKFLTKPGKKQRLFIRDFSDAFRDTFSELAEFLFQKNLCIKTKLGLPCTGRDIVDCISELNVQTNEVSALNRGYSESTTIVPYLPYFEAVTGRYGFINELSSIVGPSGATLKVGGCTVVFPKNALLKETRITLTSYYGKHGENRNITPLLKCEPHGLNFHKPVKVTLPTCCHTSDRSDPVQVWIETSADGFTWVKWKPQALENDKNKNEFVFESTHFSFLRCIVETVKLWMGILKHKRISFTKKHSNVWQCCIEDMKVGHNGNHMHTESISLSYNQSSVSVEMSSNSVEFDPPTRTITEAFYEPLANVYFTVNEKKNNTGILGDVEVHEVDFQVVSNDKSIKNNNFFVDFETLQEIDDFYQACSQIANDNWERFVRMKLHVSEIHIREAQADHGDDIKKRRCKMLKAWRKMPEHNTSLPTLNVLIEEFRVELGKRDFQKYKKHSHMKSSQDFNVGIPGDVKRTEDLGPEQTPDESDQENDNLTYQIGSG